MTAHPRDTPLVLDAHIHPVTLAVATVALLAAPWVMHATGLDRLNRGAPTLEPFSPAGMLAFDALVLLLARFVWRSGRRIVLSREGVAVSAKGRPRRLIPWSGIRGLRLAEDRDRQGVVSYSLVIRLQRGQALTVGVEASRVEALIDAVVRLSPHLLAVEGMEDPS